MPIGCGSGYQYCLPSFSATCSILPCVLPFWYFLSTREGKLAVTAREKGRGEKEDCAMRDVCSLTVPLYQEASRSQRWTGEVIALLLLITCWMAWVVPYRLPSVRPLVWVMALDLAGTWATHRQALTPPDDGQRSSAPGASSAAVVSVPSPTFLVYENNVL